MSTENESVVVKLTRMEGKLDLSNLRHQQHDERFQTIDFRLNTHGERITGIEKREIGKEGERKGFLTSGKVLMMMIGAVPVAVIAGLLKAFGG